MGNSADGNADPAAACNALADAATSLAAGEPISFVDSVMPVFGGSCNFASCHMGIRTGAFPGFGPQCQYDAMTGECRFDTGALSTDVLDSVYAALRMQSAAAPELMRVEPADLLRSFLVLKISDCQAMSPELTGCTSCGTEMPPVYALRVSSPERYDVLVRWVAQGAPR